MLSMRRCCPDKTLFTFVRVELISFLPFTDCSNCRVDGSCVAPFRGSRECLSKVLSINWKESKKLWKVKKNKHNLISSTFFDCAHNHVLMSVTFTLIGVKGTCSKCLCWIYVFVQICLQHILLSAFAQCVCVCVFSQKDTMKWVAERALPPLKH